jgi:DNA-directed RNA polymerase specialized sigma24 family protein
MKIPKNMTEGEVVAQIQIVIDRIAPRYTFPGYTIEDIKQEAFIICEDALNRYDGKRRLENFLAVNLSNRLKNFIRDNFYTKDDDEDKKRIMKPSSLSSEDFVPAYTPPESDDQIDAHEMQTLIDTHLPSTYRADYLKLINNVYVPKKRREEVVAKIKEIVHEKG